MLSQFDRSDDPTPMNEAELMANLILAAGASDEHLTTRQIDDILRQRATPPVPVGESRDA
jgi:hypothetical protein